MDGQSHENLATSKTSTVQLNFTRSPLHCTCVIKSASAPDQVLWEPRSLHYKHSFFFWVSLHTRRSRQVIVHKTERRPGEWTGIYVYFLLVYFYFPSLFIRASLWDAVFEVPRHFLSAQFRAAGDGDVVGIPLAVHRQMLCRRGSSSRNSLAMQIKCQLGRRRCSVCSWERKTGKLILVSGTV